MVDFLLGAIAMAALAASLVFARYYRRTGDRFFLFFALAFLLEAVSRFITSQLHPATENEVAVYGLRIAAYGLILWAVLDKNWPRRG